jgi:hypothetical protein
MLKNATILRGPLCAIFLIFTSLCYAQNDVTQTIRGRVLDAVTQAPIVSASVSLSEKNVKKESDTEGSFRFDKTPVGRYAVSVFCVGYQSVTLQNIVVESGKETILEIKMTASNTLLESFEVSSSTPSLSKIGLAQSINMETLQRVPANFSDVGRMLTNLAGVASESDAANHFSVRGLSPNAMQWYLEGAEIVNPNHLSNAATSSDRATQNGGGVSIFSTQVLERADFYKGVLPTDGGNALGAIVDVRFRSGNNEHKETTLGIGLVGLDVATEGSFAKNSKASYLVNYRYSTVGLLSKLGVPLGDEASAFQDISFKLRFPSQKMGNLEIFGMGGISENVFVHKKRDKWETQKDSQDITFKNQMGAIGASHQFVINKKAVLETVAVLSGLENTRTVVGLTAAELPVTENFYAVAHRKFYVKSRLIYQFEKGFLVAGLIVKDEFVNNKDWNKYQYNFVPRDTFITTGKGNFYIPFADYSSRINDYWSFSVGLRANYFDFTNKLSVEPTANLKLEIGETQSLKLSYSRQSQLMNTPQYFVKFQGEYLFKDKDFIKSDNLNLTFNNNFTNGIQLTATAFHQSYWNIFITNPEPSFFTEPNYWSILDGLNKTPYNYYNYYYGTAGSAKTVGIEANLSQNQQKGWFWQANATLFNASFYEPFTQKTRALAGNSRFIVNAYFGKEWALDSRKNRFFGFGSRTILRGGNYYRDASSLFFRNSRAANYFRSDLNVYVKKNHRKWSSIVQLDIQNVTNRLNEQYYYFDSFTQKLTPQLQLGLLPNLSYRISF